MNKKVLGIILFILIVFIIFVLISSGITISKYNSIAKNIDKQISETKKNIKEKQQEYKKLKQENSDNKKQLDNMNNYIQTLSEKVKEYEK